MDKVLDERKSATGTKISLGWQIVPLLVCLWIGVRLTNAYGSSLADCLGAEFLFARPLIVVFFAAVTAIASVLAYRAARFLKRGSQSG